MKVKLFVGLVLSTMLWLIIFIIYDEKWGAGPERHRKAIAQDKANQIPHIIRDADGCKVYAFLSGGIYHYFTRCDNSTTTTDASREECKNVYQGKYYRRVCHTEWESIETITGKKKGH